MRELSTLECEKINGGFGAQELGIFTEIVMPTLTGGLGLSVTAFFILTDAERPIPVQAILKTCVLSFMAGATATLAVLLCIKE